VVLSFHTRLVDVRRSCQHIVGKAIKVGTSLVLQIGTLHAPRQMTLPTGSPRPYTPFEVLDADQDERVEGIRLALRRRAEILRCAVARLLVNSRPMKSSIMQILRKYKQNQATSDR
jgi:hypothetical protein